jgi:long-chain acyl-CoA synthetase
MSITAEDIRRAREKITAPDGFCYQHAPKTLLEIFQNGRNHGDLDFMVYEGRRYSFTDFYAEVDALAGHLQGQLRVGKGDRVAIAMRNNPEWVVAYAAATLAGAIVVPVNSWGKTEELQYALTDSGASILVCDAARFKLIDAVLADLDIDILLVDGEASGNRVTDFKAALEAGRDSDFEPAEVSGEDPCVILYTSGSTGFPKGVVHRHIAICQSLMNMFYYGLLLMELEGARELRGGSVREAPLLTVPLFHATGLLGGLLMPLQMGQKIVMMYKWDTLGALRLIESEKITGLTSVPAVLQDLFKHPEYDNYDTSSLLRISAAGAATPSGLPELIEEKAARPSRSTGWGMTETMAAGSIMSGAVYDLHPDSAGIISPIVDMRFVGPDGNPVAEGEAGEIEVRSVVCTPGYWEKPEANASTFVEGHWMKTGDIARLDADGYLYITGRIKEIVIRGGENIYPGEIEQVAYQLPAVLENVVFGVEDAAMGEELAMVAYGKDESLTEAALREFLGERLAGYKVPRYIEIRRESLPQNASGKLHKLKVKESFVLPG